MRVGVPETGSGTPTTAAQRSKTHRHYGRFHAGTAGMRAAREQESYRCGAHPVYPEGRPARRLLAVPTEASKVLLGSDIQRLRPLLRPGTGDAQRRRPTVGAELRAACSEMRGRALGSAVRVLFGHRAPQARALRVGLHTRVPVMAQSRSWFPST